MWVRRLILSLGLASSSSCCNNSNRGNTRNTTNTRDGTVAGVWQVTGFGVCVTKRNSMFEPVNSAGCTGASAIAQP